MEVVFNALLILLACFAYGLFHSWMASHGFKQQIRDLLGQRFADRYYRLIFNLVSVVTLLPVLALAGLLPDRSLYVIRFPWLLISLAIQGLAVLALLVGLLQTGLWEFIGLRQAVGQGSEKETRLVKEGLYRWVRHPLYTAGLVFIWFSPVMTANLLALYIGLSIYLVVGAMYEERKLLRIHGDSYRSYMLETPMLIPRPPKDIFRV